jgi:hypothetical protein
MGSRKLRRGAAAVATVLGAGALVGATAASATSAVRPGDHGGAVKHVLLISVDGLHQQDLAWYVHSYPTRCSRTCTVTASSTARR